MDFEFDDLKREFLAEAEGKVNEIKSRLEATPPQAEDFDRMIYLAHQLKGAGGSYGFQTISTESAELERELESARENPAIQPSLVERVTKIAQVIDESSRELAK